MDIIVDNLSYMYEVNTKENRRALEELNLTIPSGKITGVIGHSGSGKSTLIQLIAGLLKPTSGDITIGKYNWNDKNDYQELRRLVGIVFQYPEHQLFEETVEKEIAFGPKNFGYSEQEIEKNIKEALSEIKLSYEEINKSSPFDLSGGQKRRVAIASVLACKPKVLILDEPTAGLDAKGKKDILETIVKLHKNNDLTTLIVSHNMDEVANIADNIVVLNDGQILLKGAPDEVFSNEELLRENSLDVPDITKLIIQINKKLSTKIPLNCYSIDELEHYLVGFLKEQTK